MSSRTCGRAVAALRRWFVRVGPVDDRELAAGETPVQRNGTAAFRRTLSDEGALRGRSGQAALHAQHKHKLDGGRVRPSRHGRTLEARDCKRRANVRLNSVVVVYLFALTGCSWVCCPLWQTSPDEPGNESRLVDKTTRGSNK